MPCMLYCQPAISFQDYTNFDNPVYSEALDSDRKSDDYVSTGGESSGIAFGGKSETRRKWLIIAIIVAVVALVIIVAAIIGTTGENVLHPI